MVRQWALGALGRESNIGDGDDIFRVFHLNSSDGRSLNEAQQELAFKSLGVIYHCEGDALRRLTLDYSGFREIVEKSFRRQRITSALQDVCADLAVLMEAMFPAKITDVTEEEILQIMSSQRFFAPASSRIHKSLRAAAVDVSKEASQDNKKIEEGVAEVDLFSLMSKYRYDSTPGGLTAVLIMLERVVSAGMPGALWAAPVTSLLSTKDLRLGLVCQTRISCAPSSWSTRPTQIPSCHSRLQTTASSPPPSRLRKPPMAA